MIQIAALVAAVVGGGYAIANGQQQTQIIGGVGLGLALISILIAIPVPYLNLVLSVVGAGVALYGFNTAKVDRATRIAEGLD